MRDEVRPYGNFSESKPTHSATSKCIKRPPRLSGDLPWLGHMLEFRRNPFAMLMRARAEAGEVVEFSLLNQPVVMLTGPAANEAFLRAPDDQICRREAYRVMTPIFGEGVVFDAPVPRMNSQLRMIMPMLRDQVMRSYPPLIQDEVRRMISLWGDMGEIDLLAFTKQLTIYTSTRCLIGDEFRSGINDEFFELYRHLEDGVDPLAYLFPNLPLPKFRRRDAARGRLVEMIDALMQRRLTQKDPPRDGLQVLLESTYADGSRLSSHELTGILIALILAGHHTSAGTSVWILVELLRQPDYLASVLEEIAGVTQGATALTYPMLREMTGLGAVIKETLRLHPPLIFLLRKVLRPFEYGGYVVEPGKMLCASPAVSHRIEEIFPEPERFNPERYRDESQQSPTSWIAFGGGSHKCTGNAFGALQLKTIVATLLSEYEFELSESPGRYHDDYNRPTVLPAGPCRLRYRRRTTPLSSGAGTVPKQSESALPLATSQLRVTVDRHLCQGHAVCMSEAPEVFILREDSTIQVALEQTTSHLRSTPEELRFYVPTELNQQVICAAKFCPNQAISIEEAAEEPRV